jgi:hypothetical protein
MRPNESQRHAHRDHHIELDTSRLLGTVRTLTSLERASVDGPGALGMDG